MKRSSKRPMKRPCGLWNPWLRWLRHQLLKKSQPLTSRLRRRQAKPKLDKAEITPMIEITTEENRIVFEGVVFDVEHKVTRTGRVLISFKMTDYTPRSFPFRNGSK